MPLKISFAELSTTSLIIIFSILTPAISGAVYSSRWNEML
jgi:hypothetical protein